MARACKWCGYVDEGLHDVIEAKGWPGEFVCRNILACQTRQKEQHESGSTE